MELSEMVDRLRNSDGRSMCLGSEVMGILGETNCECPTSENGVSLSCDSCRTLMRGRLADALEAARELPEGVKWPRFEDRELVKFGDEIDYIENAEEVAGFYFYKTHVGIKTETDISLKYPYGTPLKRPEPEVLDADGVPIKVGDTVYAPNAEPLTVRELTSEALTLIEDSNGNLWELRNDALTHRKPDTMDAIEADAEKDPCAYFNGRTPDKCADCKLHEGDAGFDFDVRFSECRTAMARDLLARQRKLMGGE